LGPSHATEWSPQSSSPPPSERGGGGGGDPIQCREKGQDSITSWFSKLGLVQTESNSLTCQSGAWYPMGPSLVDNLVETPSISSSPGLRVSPGSLKKLLPIWRVRMCGWLCWWTSSTASTVLLTPTTSNSSFRRCILAGTLGSSSGCASLVPNM